ncbi:SMP-30/gluconolactonase/LRE family protein [Actinomycetospora straminea]|uniref:SMP-30/gluconolactonase/LRE family protein n=1 Tax=Actinomycetospora straminea TaxID=663607 RepID=A0ABP9EI49_9PSEU|nr:SMP-30/gluconolactonase/LRE family protein [Actinomycetospora straminea]MDD7933386.1 SMP-30/gluconolactonase/LRE family protein [Actinomycetospora straminea]
MRTVATGLGFPEGPVALADGDVLVVEIRRGTLTRVAPDGTTSVVAALGGGPNGAAIGPDGAVYVCNNGGFTWHDRDGITAPGHQPPDYAGGSIQRVDLDTGEVTDLYTACDGRPLRGPNDIVFDTDGGFWFTDIGKSRERDRDTGALYHARWDGSAITEVVHPLTQPNGVGLSPDGSRLYVAETVTGRVWAWDVAGPGRLTRAAEPVGPHGPHGAVLLHGFGGYQMLDSLAVDGAGNVCVATLVTGAISVVAPDGELLRQVPVPEHDPYVTNICFAGAGSPTAWVTSSGRGVLYTLEWDGPGLDLAYTA